MIVNRNKILGQYFTPHNLAADIIKATRKYYGGNQISILEPAFGKGAFLSALVDNHIIFNDFHGVEIDRTLKTNYNNANVRISYADFCETVPDKSYDLIITNPPYTRHHLIDSKQKEYMIKAVKDETQININGLAGLHCYFLLLADKWLSEGGIGVWLLPTEFLDVNYGKAIKAYLLTNVQLLQFHIYNTNENSMFDDAIVSSCVIVYKKIKPTSDYYVMFSYGSNMSCPTMNKEFNTNELSNISKWTKLVLGAPTQNENAEPTISSYFKIQRGIATGYNKYFILSRAEIEKKCLPLCCFSPILENTRNVSNPIIENDEFGYPKTSPTLFVLDTDLTLNEIKVSYPALFDYLNYGLLMGVTDRYLVSKRKIWYKQESRMPAPFYCSYMARKNSNNESFHFIWNKSSIIVSNNFLMLYPKPILENALGNGNISLSKVYSALESIGNDSFTNEARTYATGLSKLEPTELGQVRFALDI